MKNISENEDIKIISKNRKALHEYFVLDTYEAGIALQGTEVKSLRAGAFNLSDSYGRVKDGELILIGMHISPYEKGNIFNHEPLRDRKLLLHGREIERLRKKIEEKGLTIVPLSVYLKKGRVKIEIALAKGKHLYDKRDDKAAGDAKREMNRAMKRAEY